MSEMIEACTCTHALAHTPQSRVVIILLSNMCGRLYSDVTPDVGHSRRPSRTKHTHTQIYTHTHIGLHTRMYARVHAAAAVVTQSTWEQDQRQSEWSTPGYERSLSQVD